MFAHTFFYYLNIYFQCFFCRSQYLLCSSYAWFKVQYIFFIGVILIPQNQII